MAWLGGQGSTKSGKERRRHSMFHVMEHAAARVALEKSPDRSVTAWNSLRGRNFEARPMKPAPQYHLSHPQPAEPETALLFLGSFFLGLAPRACARPRQARCPGESRPSSPDETEMRALVILRALVFYALQRQL
jgi:hypothetical protein